jgi:acyl-CoA thioester hydrolase
VRVCTPIVIVMAEGDSLSDPARVVLRRRLDWMDTDAAGIYHWTSAFRFAEAAEAAMHTALGIADRTFGATPRVKVSAEFKRSLRFNDLVDVELAVDALGRTSVRYRLTLACDAGVVATGWITSVFIDRSTRRATPWPDDIRQLLSAGGLQNAP